MATGVKDLKVWQEAVGLGGDVVRAMRQCARREIKGFTDQAIASAAAVAVAIAEGYSKYTPAEQRRCYRSARRSLAQLETLLAIARLGGLISAATLVQLSGRVSAVARLLAGYLSYIERQIGAEDGSPSSSKPTVAARMIP